MSDRPEYRRTVTDDMETPVGVAITAATLKDITLPANCMEVVIQADVKIRFAKGTGVATANHFPLSANNIIGIPVSELKVSKISVYPEANGNLYYFFLLAPPGV